MKNRLPVTILSLSMTILISGGGGVMAAEFPYPKVEFSADMKMTIEAPGSGQAYTIQGKVYSVKGKERREISRLGRTTAIIKDRYKKETVTLMPDQKMYMNNQGARAGKDPETMIRDGELTMTKQGSDVINGQTTTKYKIESTQNNEASFSGFMWLSKQNIPIRFKGTVTGEGGRQAVEINYTNVVIAKQDPDLFTIPGHFQPVPSVGGGMGGDTKGMTPEQIEKFKEMMKKQRNP